MAGSSERAQGQRLAEPSAKPKAHRAKRTRRGSALEAIAGSGALWAWGFLCYLSPVLISVPDASSSVGLEYGYFASQAAVIVTALSLVVGSRRHMVALGPAALIIAAVVMGAATIALPWLLARHMLALVILVGVVTGVAGTLCGAAWGARYSLDFRDAPGVIILSFLFAYVLYLVVSHIEAGLAAVIAVAALPVVSMGLRTDEAARRHHMSSDVFPSKTAIVPDAMPGEIIAGSWEARLLPWKSMAPIILAALIGNFISSAIMGATYEQAASLFAGGVAVCFIIAVLALVPFTLEKHGFSALSLYRTTVTFAVAGLLIILALGGAGIPMGGALVQGCAMFLQVLVYVLVTRSTQREGLAPLLSFSVGQGLISAVVLAGNILGKQFYYLVGGALAPFEIACAIGVLLLFCVVVNTKTDAAPADLAAAEAPDTPDRQTPPPSEEDRAAAFAERFKLTKREAEVLEYLVRGRSLPYIADALFVTTGTVKTHVKHIYRKCAVSTRQELLDLFEREG